MRNLLFITIAALSMSFSSVDTTSGFCEGWDDGYQAALEECLRVGITPICPIEPINSKGYKTGYGRGYGAARAKHCN